MRPPNWNILRVWLLLAPPSLVASAPPPILHPLNSYTTHLTPPIHQHRSLEVLNLDLFHDLPVKGVLKSSSDFHAVLYIRPSLMVMYAM